MNAQPNKRTKPWAVPGLLLLVMVLFIPVRGWAFSTELQHEPSPSGKGDTLSFELPSNDQLPSWELIRPKVLRLKVPNLLALPHTRIDPKTTRYIRNIVVEEIAGELGLYITLELKVPLLTFRHQVTEAKRRHPSRYILYIEPTPMPNPQDVTRIRGARILPGAEGTLVVIDHVGSAEIKDQNIDHAQHAIRLQWQGAAMDKFWIAPQPAGLVTAIHTYTFSNDLLEMEIAFHPRTGSVELHQNPKSGTLIIELRTQNMKDVKRKQDIDTILTNRLQAVAEGLPLPLNRITPIFKPSSEVVKLADQEVTEEYFMNNALAAEKDHQYGKARGYLDAILRTFPQTQNRELLAFYKVDLGKKMQWEKAGWLLEELTGVLNTYPNHYRYPEYRLLQLQLMNGAHQSERALAAMNDPNLPMNDARVVLEQARAEKGMGHDVEALERLYYLLEKMPDANVRERAGAYFELVDLETQRNHLEKAVKILEEIPDPEMTFLANDPDRYIQLATAYYNHNDFPKALDLYIRILDAYPDTPAVTPWAMLRAAMCYRFMNKEDEAKRLLDRLGLIYPNSGAQLWGRIFRVEMDGKRDVKERLQELDEIIASNPRGKAIFEAYFAKSQLQGDSGDHESSLKTLNYLLTMLDIGFERNRANLLRRRYLQAGMEQALTQRQPEYAMSLAETYGEDWRRFNLFVVPRTQLSEALMRLGQYREAQPLLAVNDDVESKRLHKLADDLANGIYPKVDQDRSLVNEREARVRVAEAERRREKEDWVAILDLLNRLPIKGLSEGERDERLRLLAKAESERGRFPQAVQNLEDLLFNRPMGDGKDYYWYATVQQAWRGDEKALPVYRKVADEAEKVQFKALALMRIGDILQKQRNLTEAKQAFEKAAELDPQASWAPMARENAKQLELVQEMAP
ncbi:Tetratricopeptide TPR_2 repeat protein [Magnetococcus marinus MC-1]|uniref:Tetratricopeptide TPR_2 repeat protein n=1 Tax=Magnetococcus marinus (strain ATCC BAA-1437 / JCM 17883 / MC-1) TaxID=156889 RepID=A0L4D5_MAGMM|nr:tetratricopeptide repeat protein [Magnetococcus marinus]ABK42828.1 Tetratricopeptide TPR_2 repeat protein [Magnetococcus marinus MC-1]